MILPCEIPYLDIHDAGRNHILLFFLVPVRKNHFGIRDLFRQLVWSKGVIKVFLMKTDNK